MKYRYLPLLATLFPILAMAADPDPSQLIKQALDNWRGKSSYTEVSMTVHRPDWERSMSMLSWTLHDDYSLVRFTAPAKDAGNATLKLGNVTWIYNPKLNQVIKLPASMLAQSWMGSDFSYNDLSKAEDVLTQYTHRIIGTAQADGRQVYTIEALPKPGAPVVWGKQEVRVRDDGIFLQETFFDQAMQPVRRMTTERIGPLGGRTYPLVLIMRPVGEPGRWTRLETISGQFNSPLPNYLFTRSNLQNPRD